MLVIGTAIVIVVANDPKLTPALLPFASYLFFAMAVMLLLPSFAGGVALLRGKDWGRILVAVVSVELLFAFPLGTMLGGFGLWALLRNGFSAPVASMPVASLPARASGRESLLLVMAGVAAAFLMLIGGGFLLFGGAASGVSPVPILGAGVLMMASVLAIQAYGRRTGSGTAKVASTPALSAPPSIVTAAPLCPHLQPIEGAMRAAGIEIRQAPFAAPQASCRVSLASLQRRFGPLGPVTYAEYFQPERSPEDNPTACLRCRECQGSLYTLHPVECTTRTPWFPSGPTPLTLLSAPQQAIRGSVTAVAVSPSGTTVAVASASGQGATECVIWDTGRREAIARFPLPCEMRALAWTADERTVIAGRGAPSAGGSGRPGASLFLFDAVSGAELQRFANDLCGVRGIAVLPGGGRLLVSAMLGKTRADGSAVELWEPGSGRKVDTVAQVDASSEFDRLPFFTGVACSPDRRLMVAGCDRYLLPGWRGKQLGAQPPWWWTRGVRVWDGASGKELDLLRHFTGVAQVAVSADSSLLFAAGERVGMWRLTDGALLWDQRGLMEQAAAASPDGNLVACGRGWRDNHGPYQDTAVELYDGRTGQYLTMGEHWTPPGALAFIPGQDVLVAGGEEGELRFWSLPREAPRTSFPV